MKLQKHSQTYETPTGKWEELSSEQHVSELLMTCSENETTRIHSTYTKGKMCLNLAILFDDK